MFSHRSQERSLPGVANDQDLTERAFSIVEEMMNGYGNVLSRKHCEALFALASRYTHLATGHLKGRYGFPLPCGGGKTVSAIAWCAANWQLQKGHSVLICTAHLPELCKLKSAMIKQGVPEEQIGVLHSCKSLDESRGITYLSTDKNDKRQYLLISHARAQGKVKDSDPIVDLAYLGSTRSLVIYDESLMLSDKWSLSLQQIADAHSAVKHYLKFSCSNHERLKPVEQWLGECANRLEAEFFRQRSQSQKAGELKPEPVCIPYIDDDDLAGTIGNTFKGHTNTILELQRFSANELRVVIDTQKGAAVYFQPTFPDHLDSVAVLDASILIRHLSTAGGKLSVDPDFDGDVKSYEDVTFHHLVHSSGREATERLFSLSQRDRKITKELSEVIKSRPSSEGFVVMTFKHKGSGPDIESIIRRDLKSQGVSPDEIVFPDIASSDKVPRTKVTFMTWGQEIGTNDYAHYQNMIFVGTLFKPRQAIVGEIIGEHRDLKADVSGYKAVERSEMIHSLYQGTNRCRMRVMNNGKALPANVWVICSLPDLQQHMEPALPGAVWKTWEAKYLDQKGHATEDVAKSIVAYLNGLPSETSAVSSRKLKVDTGLSDIPDKTFKTARDRALCRLSDWTQEGRSLCRSNVD